MVEIRSGRLPRKVALMTEERGFMGKEVVDRLEMDIAKERQDHIDRRLKDLNERAEKEGIAAETIVLKKASIRRIIEIAREKNVNVIIAEKRLEKISDAESVPFEVIRVKD
jgi:nucleotide-binding universal stress UspA family protein